MATSSMNVKVLDGGFGGQLSRHVNTKIDGDPLWTSRFLAVNTAPIYDTHLDFLRAGADVIETCTYQASQQGLMKYANISTEQSVLLMSKAVSIARKAVDTYMAETANNSRERPLVAGSCGPYGAYLHDGSEYTGKYGKTVSRQELMDFHRPRMRALLDAQVDLLALETIPCEEEADALVELLREFPNARAWFSFNCRDHQHLADGSNFKKVALRCYRALPSQIVAVGVNCVPPDLVTPLLNDINERNETSENFIPLVAYPNKGTFSVQEGQWISASEQRHGIDLPISDWLNLGVRYIGGCCKIFSEDIKKIRLEVDQYRRNATVAT